MSILQLIGSAQTIVDYEIKIKNITNNGVEMKKINKN